MPRPLTSREGEQHGQERVRRVSVLHLGSGAGLASAMGSYSSPAMVDEPNDALLALPPRIVQVTGVQVRPYEGLPLDVIDRTPCPGGYDSP